MPSKTDNISKLYNSLKNAGYQDIGTEQEFRDYCGDEKNVKTLHEALTNEGYDDVGTESEFESWLHPDNGAAAKPRPTEPRVPTAQHQPGTTRKPQTPAAPQQGKQEPGYFSNFWESAKRGARIFFGMDDDASKFWESAKRGARIFFGMDDDASKQATPKGGTAAKPRPTEPSAPSLSLRERYDAAKSQFDQKMGIEPSFTIWRPTEANARQDGATTSPYNGEVRNGETTTSMNGEARNGAQTQGQSWTNHQEKAIGAEAAMQDKYGQMYAQDFDKEGEHPLTPAFMKTVQAMVANGDAPTQEDAVSYVFQKFHAPKAMQMADSVAKGVVGEMPETIKDDEMGDTLASHYYTKTVQDQLHADAAKMGFRSDNDYDQYVDEYVKPMMVRELASKYRYPADQAQAIANALFSHEADARSKAKEYDPEALNDDERRLYSLLMSDFNKRLAEDRKTAEGKANAKAEAETASNLAIGGRGGHAMQLGVPMETLREYNAYADPSKAVNYVLDKLMGHGGGNVIAGGNGDGINRQAIGNLLYRKIMDKLVQERIPKSKWGYVLKGFMDGDLGELFKNYTQTDFERHLDNLADSKYMQSLKGFSGMLATGGHEATKFLSDAWEYYLGGKVGSAVTGAMRKRAIQRFAGDLVERGIQRNVAEGIAARAFQRTAQNAGRKAVMGAIHGAGTMGTAQAISGSLRQSVSPAAGAKMDEILQRKANGEQIDKKQEAQEIAEANKEAHSLTSVLGAGAKGGLSGAVAGMSFGPGTYVGETVSKWASKYMGDLASAATGYTARLGTNAASATALGQAEGTITGEKPEGSIGNQFAQNLVTFALLDAQGAAPRMLNSHPIKSYRAWKEYERSYGISTEDQQRMRDAGYGDLIDTIDGLVSERFRDKGSSTLPNSGWKPQEESTRINEGMMKLLSDNTLPEELKRKYYSLVTGDDSKHLSPVVASEVTTDENGNHYLVTYNKYGNVVSDRQYHNEKSAQDAQMKIGHEQDENLTDALQQGVFAKDTDALLEHAYQAAVDAFKNGDGSLGKGQQTLLYLYQNKERLTKALAAAGTGEPLSESDQRLVSLFNTVQKQLFEHDANSHDGNIYNIARAAEAANGLASNSLYVARKGHTEKEAKKLAEENGEEAVHVGGDIWRTASEDAAVKDYQQRLYDYMSGIEEGEGADVKEPGRLDYKPGEEAAAQQPPTEPSAPEVPDATQQPPTEPSMPKETADAQPPAERDGSAPYKGAAQNGSGPEQGQQPQGQEQVSQEQVSQEQQQPQVLAEGAGQEKTPLQQRIEEGYQRGMGIDSDETQLAQIQHDTDFANQRFNQAFGDGKMSAFRNGMIAAVQNDDEDAMRELLDKYDGQLSDEQKEATYGLIEIGAVQNGIDDSITSQTMEYQDQRQQELAGISDAQGNITKLTLTDGTTAYLKNGDITNEYGGVMVVDEIGETKQIPVSSIKQVDEPVSAQQQLEEDTNAFADDLKTGYQRLASGADMLPGQQADINISGKMLHVTVDRELEDGRYQLIMDDGSPIVLTSDEMQQAVAAARSESVSAELANQKQRRAAQETEARRTKGIAGYADGKPDLGASNTDPAVAGEYLRQKQAADGKDPLPGIESEIEAQKSAQQQAQQDLDRHEQWMEINGDLYSPEDKATKESIIEQRKKEIADTRQRIRKLGEVRNAYMSSEQRMKFRNDRMRKSEEARKTALAEWQKAQDAEKPKQPTVDGIDNKTLLDNYATQSDAEDYLQHRREEILQAYRDGAASTIADVQRRLQDYTNGLEELTDDDLKSLYTHLAEAKEQERIAMEQAKQIKAQQQKLGTLYKERNKEELDKMSPADRRTELLKGARTPAELLKKAHEAYKDSDFENRLDELEPETLEEYVSQNLGYGTLNWEGTGSGISKKKGLKQELGLTRGIGHGFDSNGINAYLAPTGQGMSVDMAAHKMWEGSRGTNFDKYDDQDFKNAILDLLGSARKATDIKYLTLRNRINEVEDYERHQEEQERWYKEQQDEALKKRQQDIDTYNDYLNATAESNTFTPEQESYLNGLYADEIAEAEQEEADREAAWAAYEAEKEEEQLKQNNDGRTETNGSGSEVDSQSELRTDDTGDGKSQEAVPGKAAHQPAVETEHHAQRQAGDRPAHTPAGNSDADGGVSLSAQKLKEIKERASQFSSETEEESGTFGRLVPKMSDEELLAYMRLDGNGDPNEANHPELYDEYDSRHNDEEVEAYNSYLQQLRDSGTTAEQAEDMLANVQLDYKTYGATDERSMLNGQQDALIDYISELNHQEEERYPSEEQEKEQLEMHEVDTDKLFNDLKAGKTVTLNDYYKDEGVGEDFDLAIDEAHDRFLSQLYTFKEKPTRKMLEGALADRDKWIDELAALFKSGKSEGIVNGKYVKNVDVLESMANMLGQRKALQELLDRDFKAGDAAQQRPTERASESDHSIGATDAPEKVATERENVNTEPTDGQKEAGNYKKGHIKVDGYDITIENPKGSTRSGKDASGKAWSVPMHYDYGYIKGTEGVDGDHIDVYLSDNPTSGNVYVVDQIDQKTGKFDEHKVMYGFPSMEAAVEAYKGQYEDGWKVGTVTEVSREDFKKWVESSKRKTKPFADYKNMEAAAKQQRTEPSGSLALERRGTEHEALPTLKEPAVYKNNLAGGDAHVNIEGNPKSGYVVRYYDNKQEADINYPLAIGTEYMTAEQLADHLQKGDFTVAEQPTEPSTPTGTNGVNVSQGVYGTDDSTLNGIQENGSKVEGITDGEPSADELSQLSDVLDRTNKVVQDDIFSGNDNDESWKSYIDAKKAFGRAARRLSVKRLSELVDGKRHEDWYDRLSDVSKDVLRDVSKRNSSMADNDLAFDEVKAAQPPIAPVDPPKRISAMDFAGKDKSGNQAYNGVVYHDGGYVIGTDGHVLFAQHTSYPKELEGKTTDKKGSVTGSGYPKWRSVIPDMDSSEELGIDTSALHRFVCGVLKRDKKAMIAVRDRAGHISIYKAKDLDMFLRAAGSCNADVRLVSSEPLLDYDVDNYEFVFSNDKGTGLIMSFATDDIRHMKALYTFDGAKADGSKTQKNVDMADSLLDEVAARNDISEHATMKAEELKGREVEDLRTLEKKERAQADTDEQLAKIAKGEKRDKLLNDVKAHRANAELAKRVREEKEKEAKDIWGFHRAPSRVGRLTKREIALRDALNDAVRETGIEVIEDVEEGQRVLDMANDALLSKSKKRALETASLGTSPRSLTAIPSADGAKVLNNLDNLVKEYENFATQPKTFVGQVADALGIPREKFKDKSSRYATFETKNGKIVTIRISNHNATASNLDVNGQEDAISIVVSNKRNNGITNDGDAHIVEYYYNAIKLRKAEGKPLADIVRSIKQALYSGEFNDTTGLAERQEVNIPAKVRKMMVYHGSGNDFDMFQTMRHLGEGEGNQAFGVGTYVTDQMDLGKKYAYVGFERQRHRVTEGTLDGKPINWNHPDTPGYVFVAFDNVSKYGKEEALKSLKQNIVDYESLSKLNPDNKSWQEHLEESKKAYDLVSGCHMTIKLPNGNHAPILYTVNIPDDNGHNYLDWDKAIDEDATREIVDTLYSKLLKSDKAQYLYRTKENKAKLLANLNQGIYGRRKFGDVYLFVSSELESDKAASEFLHDLGYTGIKVHASHNSNDARYKDNWNYIIFNDKDLKIKDKVRFFRTANGEAYGYTVGGKIYEDPRIASSDTPIHEYAHLWAAMLRKVNPKEWENVIKLMKDTWAWDYVKKLYPDLKAEDEIADEALAMFSGKRGAEQARKAMEEFMEESMDGKDDLKTAAKKGLMRLKEALSKFWKNVCDLLHVHFTSAEEVADRVMYDMLRGFKPDNIDRGYREDRDYSKEEDSQKDAVVRYRLADPDESAVLDDQPTVKVYRAMQLIDGKLYPPMMAAVKGKLVEPRELGQWEIADERPGIIEKIKKNKAGEEIGYVTLDKGSKDSTGKKGTPIKGVAYNPYWHTSRSPLNDQFKSAWIRPNIVTVEVEVPVSELRSGYRAKYAKDPVGETDWHSGSVTKQLTAQGHSPRKVILSRYDKPVRVLSAAETAERIIDYIGDYDVTIPENVVTPQVRVELEKRGIKIGAPEKGVKKTEQIREAIERGLSVSDDMLRDTEVFDDGEKLPIYVREGGYGVSGLNNDYRKLSDLLDAFRDKYPQYVATFVDSKGEPVDPDNLITWKFNNPGDNNDVSKHLEVHHGLSIQVEPWRKYLKGSPLQSSGLQNEKDTAPYKGAAQDGAYSSAEHDAYIARKTRNALAAVKHWADKMNLGDKVTVLTSTDGLQGKKARAKGWFVPKDGKITIVLPNHTDVGDVIRTLFHEGVAHYGLRQLFGEHFDTFLDNVYNNADHSVKSRIRDLELKYDGDKHKATEEYLAGLAEDTDFEHTVNSSWWSRIKNMFLDMLAKVGLKLKHALTDADLRYVLWRSYENMRHPGEKRAPADGHLENPIEEIEGEKEPERAVEKPKAVRHEPVVPKPRVAAEKQDIASKIKEIKAAHGNPLVLINGGGYLSAYGKDAEVVAKLFGTELIRRGGKKDGLALTSIMSDDLDRVLPRLIRAGHRVAVADERDIFAGEPGNDEAIVFDKDDIYSGDSMNRRGAATREHTEQEKEDMRNAAEELGETLGGVTVTMEHNGKDGIKGSYNTGDGTVHVNLDEADGIEDIEATVAHEVLGHEGLKALFGSNKGVDKFGQFIYDSASKKLRRAIVEKAAKEGYEWTDPQRFTKAAQEVFADIASDGPANADEFSLWRKVKHYVIRALKALGIRIRGIVNDHDLRYYVLKTGKAVKKWSMMDEETQREAAEPGRIMYSRRGKPRKRKDETMAQYIERLRTYERWKQAEEKAKAANDPIPEKEDYDQQAQDEYNKAMDDWHKANNIQPGDKEPSEFPKRKDGESPQEYAVRVADYESQSDIWKTAPNVFDYMKKAQDEYHAAYEAWKTRYDLQEMENVDEKLYSGEPISGDESQTEEQHYDQLEVEHAVEQDAARELGDAVGMDLSAEGAQRHAKLAVIERRKNLESASADDAIFIHDLCRDIDALAKEKGMKPAELREKLIDVIESPVAQKDADKEVDKWVDVLNNMRAFQDAHSSITADGVKAAMPELNALSHLYVKYGVKPSTYEQRKEIHDAAKALADKFNAYYKDTTGYNQLFGDDIMQVGKYIVKMSDAAYAAAAASKFAEDPDVKAIVDRIHDWYDNFFHTIEDAGLRGDAGYVENGYINHIWDKEKSDADAWEKYVENYQRTKSGNMRHRTISTYADGIEVGLVPKFNDVAQIMSYYSRQNNEAIANKKFLDDLSFLTVSELNKDGEVVRTLPVLNSHHPSRFDEEKYKMYHVPGVGDVWVLKEVSRRFSSIFGTMRTQDIPDWLSKIGKGYDLLGSTMKKIQLSINGFHMGALSEVALAQMRPDRGMKAIFKYILLDSIRNHGEIPAYAHPEDFKLAASHLVQLGATQDYAASDVNMITERFRNYVRGLRKDEAFVKQAAGGALTPLAVALDFINKGMDKLLWNYLHDGLKIACFKQFAEQIDRRVEKEGLTSSQRDRLLDEAGQYVNDTFGGQYWELLNVSPAALKWMRRALLSPDWFVSTQRHFFANFGFGSIYDTRSFGEYVKESLHLKKAAAQQQRTEPGSVGGIDADGDIYRKFRSKEARLCYVLGVCVFFYTMMNGLNAVTRAWDENKEKEKADEMRKTNPDYKSPYELAYPDGMKWYDYTMFGNSLGQQTHLFLGRYADGTEMYVRWGKQFREFPEMFIGRKGLDFPAPMIQRMMGKANPVIGLVRDNLGALGIWGFENSNDIADIQAKYGKAIGLLAMNARHFLPFSLPTQADKEFKMMDLFMPSSKGFTRYKAVDYFKDFIKSGDMEGVARTYKAATMNGIDAEKCLQAAITTLQAEQRDEMRDGIKDVGSACTAYDHAKTLTEKKAIRTKMIKLLAGQNYKAFTRDEAMQMIEDYMNGDNVAGKDNDRYIELSNSGDIRADYRLSAIGKQAKKFVGQIKDAQSSGDASAAESLANRYGSWIEINTIINRERSAVNKLKKQLGKGNDKAVMNEIREVRKQAQQLVDALPAPK